MGTTNPAHGEGKRFVVSEQVQASRRTEVQRDESGNHPVLPVVSLKEKQKQDVAVTDNFIPFMAAMLALV